MQIPRPPFPNALRAVIFAPIGMVVVLLVVAFVRSLQGVPIYLIPFDFELSLNLMIVNFDIKIMDAWFFDDEATLMFAFLGATIGFMWGSGAMYDFDKERRIKQERAETRALALPTALPDPDAPRIIRNPFLSLISAIPAMGITTLVVIIAIAVVALIPILPGTSIQTSNPEADALTAASNASIDILGIRIDGVDQSVAFILLSAFVLVNLLGIAATIALVIWLLNRQVRVVEKLDPDPQGGSDLLPIRFIRFINEWVLDILNGVSSAVRPR